MTRTRACAAFVAIALISLGGTPASAQWLVGAGVRAPRFSGGAFQQASEGSLHPYRPTMLEIGVHRAGSRVGVGLRAHYASSSLALEGNDVLSAVKDAMTLYGFEPELSVRLSRLGPETVVRLFAGPVFQVWNLPDVGSRLRGGVTASLGLEVPFGGRWLGSARVGAAVTPSPFNAEDLDEAFERRTLWRRDVSASLSYRL
ncbi:MAG: hypothetical protein M3Q93_14155 [Gemmatimonadota bacterium]|nr:hypothetical protein [Gemmatimonadota bacterium]